MSQFINATDIDNVSTYINQRKELEEKILNYKEELLTAKTNKNKENDITKELRKKIVNEKNEINFEKNEIQEKIIEKQYFAIDK